MLVLLKQGGPRAVAGGSLLGGALGAEVLGTGSGNHGFVLKLLLDQIFSVFWICFC